MVDLALDIYEGIGVAEDFGSGSIDKYESIAVAEYAIISRKEDFSSFLRSYPFVEITTSNLGIIDLGSGYEQIIDYWGDTKKGFQITFPVSTVAEAIPFRQFYERNYGKQFFFTSPIDNVQYTVRIVDDSYQLQRTAYQTVFARINLIEVF